MPLHESPRRRAAKRGLRRLFELLQRLHVDVLPHHFYSQIPTIAELRSNQRWRLSSSMEGIAGLDVETQLSYLRDWCRPEALARLEDFDLFAEACRANGEHGFGPVESVVLYCYLGRVQPPRVVQVGCGVATAVMLRAAEDFGFECEITCVDPFPTEFLRSTAKRGEIKLLDLPAQDVSLEVLAGIGARGLLFVDSTHTVKPGSEVNRLILEVLPRLPDGAHVHYHDIWFPYDYTPGILTSELFFWAESTLLHAFLIDNRRFRVTASLSVLHYRAQEQLLELLPGYRPIRHEHGYALSATASGDSAVGHFPSSCYMRVGSDPAAE